MSVFKRTAALESPSLRRMIWDGFFDSVLIRLPFLCVLLILGGWALGLALFVLAMQMPERPPVSHATDGIVVLTGGPSRLAEGVSLWRAGAARHLLISGVHESVSWDDLQRTLPDSYRDRMPECCLTLDQASRSTRDNMARTAAWVKDNKISTIRLVTARYHMPRALLMMKKDEPDLDVLAHPVDTIGDDGIDAHDTRGDAAGPADPVFYPAHFPVRLVIKEYHKTLAALGEWVVDSWAQRGGQGGANPPPVLQASP